MRAEHSKPEEYRKVFQYMLSITLNFSIGNVGQTHVRRAETMSTTEINKT